MADKSKDFDAALLSRYLDKAVDMGVTLDERIYDYSDKLVEHAWVAWRGTYGDVPVFILAYRYNGECSPFIQVVPVGARSCIIMIDVCNYDLPLELKVMTDLFLTRSKTRWEYGITR